jgi:bifunctional non-homologous end joining protein LigD
MPRTDSLKAYRAKRDFKRTPEPEGSAPGSKHQFRFVVQKHAASHLHYDFRLEVEGVLKSWAVPKGPSLNPAEKRLAMRTEDHPLGYLKFEGVIPQGEYGGGSVIVWDIGAFRNLKSENADDPDRAMAKGIENGRVEIWLDGQKIKGGFALVRTRGDQRDGRSGTREQWLLIKRRDEYARADDPPVLAQPQSVLTGRTVEEVGAGTKPRKPVRRAGSNGSPRPNGATRTKARATNRRTAPSSAAQPAFIEPMLATLTDQRDFPGPRGSWVFERKLDGFRAVAYRHRQEVRLLSRNEKDLGVKYPEIVEALRQQPLDDFIIDGEIVAFDHGQVSFQQLQQRLKRLSLDEARSSGVAVSYYVFDLLYANGLDARPLALKERKRLLKQAVEFTPLIRFTTHRLATGREALQLACERGWEGLIAKRAATPYISGRSHDWLKVKCGNRQEFVVGGYTDPQRTRIVLGALLVGYYEDGALRYAGKVGTGYTQETLRMLGSALNPLTVATNPFQPDAAIPRRNVHWVKPKLVAEIEFSEWTREGKLRHPRFMGLRPDKAAKEVVRERPAAIE